VKTILCTFLMIVLLPVAALAVGPGAGPGGAGDGFGALGDDLIYIPSYPVSYSDDSTGLTFVLDSTEGLGDVPSNTYYFRLPDGVWFMVDVDLGERTLDKVYVYFGNSYGAFVNLQEWVYCPFGDQSRYNPTAIVSFLQAPTASLTVIAHEAWPPGLPSPDVPPSYTPNLTGDPAIDAVLSTLSLDNSTLARKKKPYCLCGQTSCDVAWLWVAPIIRFVCGTPPNCFYEWCEDTGPYPYE